MDDSERMYLLETARILDKHPNLPIPQLHSIVQDKLATSGLDRSRLIELGNRYRDLHKTFSFKGVINPVLLREKTGKRFYFFLVDARQGRYAALWEITRQWEGDLSRFVVYGQNDVVLRLHGTIDEESIILDTLAKSGFELAVMEVESIPYFWRYKVDPPSKVKKIREDILHKLVENFNTSDVSDMVRREMLSKNLLLGCTVIEDLTQTNRIKSFVGVTLVGVVPLRFRRELIDRFLGMEELRDNLVSIYQCKGGIFDYILEIVTDNMTSLDIITDKLYTLYNAVSTIETYTLVVAKAEEKLPSIRKEESLVLPGISYEDYLGYIRKIEQQFIPHFDTKLKNMYSNLSPRDRHFLTGAIDELMSLNLESLTSEDRSRIQESVMRFASGFVSKRYTEIETSVSLITSLLEQMLRRSIYKLVKVFLDGDFSRAQKELRLPHKDPRKFMLGQCYKFFEQWSKTPRYRSHREIPDQFLESLSRFSNVRNLVVHGATRWSEFDSAAKRIKDAVLDGLVCIVWLQENLLAHDPANT